ncbi:hypothetical protein J504_2564 [Acinetobacter baumannii 348935]|nr:hypothetical protein J504_2564 [Acinetobacter baumannii 348935]
MRYSTNNSSFHYHCSFMEPYKAKSTPSGVLFEKLLIAV